MGLNKNISSIPTKGLLALAGGIACIMLGLFWLWGGIFAMSGDDNSGLGDAIGQFSIFISIFFFTISFLLIKAFLNSKKSQKIK